MGKKEQERKMCRGAARDRDGGREAASFVKKELRALASKCDSHS